MPVTKIDNIAYNEGRKAFFYRNDIRDNPYINNPNEEVKEFSWEHGFNTASREDEIEYEFNAD